MALVLISGFPVQAIGEPIASGFPALNVSTNGDTTEYSFPLQILLLMTALTVLPSLVLGMTSFTRIIIVMSILRQALGTQQTPPNQVLIAISLFLTFLSWLQLLIRFMRMLLYRIWKKVYLQNKLLKQQVVK